MFSNGNTVRRSLTYITFNSYFEIGHGQFLFSFFRLSINLCRGLQYYDNLYRFGRTPTFRRQIPSVFKVKWMALALALVSLRPTLSVNLCGQSIEFFAVSWPDLACSGETPAGDSYSYLLPEGMTNQRQGC